VEAGDQKRRGIEALEIFGAVGPTQRGERPQAGAEPGVENIGILAQFAAAFRTRGWIGARDDGLATGIAVPGWNAMSPPELARDAPVADVVHPFIPGFDP